MCVWEYDGMSVWKYDVWEYGEWVYGSIYEE